MAYVSYFKMHVLIVDDFANFRATMKNMLLELGVGSVDSAESGEAALALCQTKTYDLILCDHNLGTGKSGQQVLEELRVTDNPCTDSLFILVSAETSKSIIMATYDYEPDAYLTKPLTAKALDQRLEKLCEQRFVLRQVSAAQKKGDVAATIELCKELIEKDGRHTNACQKLLGEIYLSNNDIESAEKLYRSVLDQRELEWAQLGIVKAKIIQGDLLNAQQLLEGILQQNSLCLKAYDLQADIFRALGDAHALQSVLKAATELSPLSIVRQQTLGEVALQNNDFAIAATALKTAVKLGDNSCLDKADSHAQFAQAAISLCAVDQELGQSFLRDALKCVANIETKFGSSTEKNIQLNFLESQLQTCSGNESRALELIKIARVTLEEQTGIEFLDAKIEMIRALRLTGRNYEAQKLLKVILKEYENDEEALQKLDILLDEPSSEKNKLMVADINKKGIAAYNNKDFSAASEAFNTALQKLPRHIGLRLNYVQTLIDTLKLEFDGQLSKKIFAELFKCDAAIDRQHPQYKRYRQLDDMYNTIIDKVKKQRDSL